jgi:hypothetical protein
MDNSILVRRLPRTVLVLRRKTTGTAGYVLLCNQLGKHVSFQIRKPAVHQPALLSKKPNMDSMKLELSITNRCKSVKKNLADDRPTLYK